MAAKRTFSQCDGIDKLILIKSDPPVRISTSIIIHSPVLRRLSNEFLTKDPKLLDNNMRCILELETDLSPDVYIFIDYVLTQHEIPIHVSGITFIDELFVFMHKYEIPFEIFTHTQLQTFTDRLEYHIGQGSIFPKTGNKKVCPALFEYLAQSVFNACFTTGNKARIIEVTPIYSPDIATFLLQEFSAKNENIWHYRCLANESK